MTHSRRATVQYAAQAAVQDVETLIAAAEAAHRAGTWMPAGATNARDYEVLSAAQDVMARAQRRNRPRRAR